MDRNKQTPEGNAFGSFAPHKGEVGSDSLLLRLEQRRRNRLRHSDSYFRVHMGIDPRCDIRAGVTQVSRDVLNVFSGIEKEGSVGMTKTVDGHFVI
jgi:hypothetical protein